MLDRAASVEFNFAPFLGLTDTDRAAALRGWLEAQGLAASWTPQHTWLLYDGTRWVPNAEDYIIQQAYLLGYWLRVRAGVLMAEGKDGEAKRYAQAARRFLSVNGVTAAMAALRPLPGILAEGNDYDADPDVLGLKNGVLDLRTGVLERMTPEHRITQVVDVPYNPEATAPRWEKFLTEVLIDSDRNTDHDLIEYLQRVIGYGITGHTREHMFILATGSGRNGKGVFANTLGRVFRGITRDTRFATFEKKREINSSAPSPDVAALAGARLVLISESGVNAKFDTAFLRGFVAGDPQVARQLHQKEFTFTPRALVWIATNHAPEVDTQVNAVWSRVKQVRWRRQFADHEQDKTLEWKLLEEAEGIVRWAVEGARKWYADGLREPASVREATLDYKEQSDPLAEFIDTWVVETGDSRDVVFTADLWQALLKWQDEEREIFFRKRKTFINYLIERFGEHRLVKSYDPNGGTRDSKPQRFKGYRLRSPEGAARYLARLRDEAILEAGGEVEGEDTVVSLAARLTPDKPLQAVKYAKERRFSSAPID